MNEPTNIQQKHLLQTWKCVSEFINSLDSKDAGIRYADSEAIMKVKASKKFKLNVRSALGVIDPTLWIFSLNIGNVMNLSPMSHDELGSIN